MNHFTHSFYYLYRYYYWGSRKREKAVNAVRRKLI